MVFATFWTSLTNDAAVVSLEYVLIKLTIANVTLFFYEFIHSDVTCFHGINNVCRSIIRAVMKINTFGWSEYKNSQSAHNQNVKRCACFSSSRGFV